jgi:hypothetical protein
MALVGCCHCIGDLVSVVDEMTVDHIMRDESLVLYK